MKKLNVAATNPIVSSPRADINKKLGQMLMASERDARKLTKLGAGIDAIMDARWSTVDAPETDGNASEGLTAAMQAMEKQFQSIKDIIDARVIEAAGDVAAYLNLIGCPEHLRPECEGFYTVMYINKMVEICNREY